MMLIEETTVPDTALPVTQFKAHLRLGTGFAESDVQDEVLKSYLRAAIAAIEARTGRILITRAFSWTVSKWRNEAGEILPVSPVQAVTEMVWIARDGTESLVPGSAYRVEQDDQRPRLSPSGNSLPMIAAGATMRVALTAGMGLNWGELPADLGQAVLLLAAHYYEYRNETALGDGCMPFGVTSLIQRYRVMRFGLGMGA